MITLNDKQADKICEIVDIKFHHYQEAQYTDPEYNDIDPQYYFWSVPVGRSSFKINRLTGEFRFDELYDKSISLFNMEDLLNLKGKGVTSADRLIENLQNYTDKKNKVLEYLKSEGLL
jgi:hypothetical protein